METVNAVDQLPFVLFLSMKRNGMWVLKINKDKYSMQRRNQRFPYVSFETCAVFQVFTVQILFVEANTWDYISSSTNSTLALPMSHSLRPGKLPMPYLCTQQVLHHSFGFRIRLYNQSLFMPKNKKHSTPPYHMKHVAVPSIPTILPYL